MKLIDLFPQFIKLREATEEEIAADGWEGKRPHWLIIPVNTLAEADGIRFTDPMWAATHPGQDGRRFGGTVYVAFAGHDPLGLISSGDGGPTKWSVSGTGYVDLKLSPSIFVDSHRNPPGWHGFVGLHVPGEVTNA
jgi:hypothetical protein